MKDQLIKILTHFGITATRFADEIGVQRSSISHILSGRNKPSYDFILRIIEKYPSLNPSWLLTGNGNMMLTMEESKKSEEKETVLPLLSPKMNVNTGSENIDLQENSQKSVVDISQLKDKVTSVNRIDHVILLFTDGTFTQYNSNE
jgi:plasmid maintenance system antidote protein VapI